jgi:hypothetical protein
MITVQDLSLSFKMVATEQYDNVVLEGYSAHDLTLTNGVLKTRETGLKNYASIDQVPFQCLPAFLYLE